MSSNSTIVDNTIELKSNNEASLLFGNHDKNLRIMRDVFDVKIIARNGFLKYEGEIGRVKKLTDVINRLLYIIRTSGRLDEDDFDIILADIDRGTIPIKSEQEIELFTKGQPVTPKTNGQVRYVDAIKKNDLVFCIGPAGYRKDLFGCFTCPFYIEERRS